MNVSERLVLARGNTPRTIVAEAIGVTVSAIAMYERGERVPRDEIKVRLADYYNMSVQDLFYARKSHAS